MRLTRAISARFPSAPDVRLAYVTCALVVYNWLAIQYLYRVPGWLFYQKPWDLTGILGYGLVFAAIESVSLLLVLLALAIVLPGRLLRDKFLVGATVWVAITAIWAGLSHYKGSWLREAGPTGLAALVTLYIASLVLVGLVAYRYRPFQVRLRSFLESAALQLYFLYLPATVLALVVIVWRNIG